MKRFSNIRGKLPSFALMSLYAYLAFHAFSGSQGLLSWISYSDEAEVLQARFDERQAQHAALKARVEALSGDELDLDALEIAARRDLFVSDAKEMTIWLDP